MENIAIGQAMRNVMSRFPTGVTVITVEDLGRWQGMTANSVNSVSLEPPLVSVAIDARAYTLELIQRAGHFAINLLASDQAELSRRFARPGARGESLFQGITVHRAATGDPILAGVTGHVTCVLYASYPAGDHSLILGEVIEARWGEAKEPLVFYHSQYHQIAPLNQMAIQFHPF